MRSRDRWRTDRRFNAYRRTGYRGARGKPRSLLHTGYGVACASPARGSRSNPRRSEAHRGTPCLVSVSAIRDCSFVPSTATDPPVLVALHDAFFTAPEGVGPATNVAHGTNAVLGEKRNTGNCDSVATTSLVREKLVRAMFEEVLERGYQAVTESGVADRAGVSRSVLEALFEDREGCFRAVLDWGLSRIIRVIVPSLRSGSGSVPDKVRDALAALLDLLDKQPLWARVWLLEAPVAGAWKPRHRELSRLAIHAALRPAWAVKNDYGAFSSVLDGIISGVVGVLQLHLAHRSERPFVGLLGSLMAVVAAPFMSSQDLCREIRRCDERVQRSEAQRRKREVALADECARSEMPAVLQNRAARRGRMCVLYLSGVPGASNREIAAGVGLAHESQTSRLLSSLRDAGLLEKESMGVGKRNEWRLTERGRRAAREISGAAG